MHVSQLALHMCYSMAAQVNYELDYQRLNSSSSSQTALNPVTAHAQVVFMIMADCIAIFLT